MDPVQFAFGLMTRSKAITWDNLELRAPEFVAKADRHVRRPGEGARARAQSRRAADVPALRLRDMTARQPRGGVAHVHVFGVDGVPNDWHLMHYGRGGRRRRAVFTEMTCVTPQRPASPMAAPGCGATPTRRPGSASSISSTPIRRRRSACSSAMPGRKGATKLMWEGMDEPLEEGAWPIVSASPLPYFPAQPGAARAHARRHGRGDRGDFVAAAERGERAGFDMLELHCAHGYLLASFISPLTNIRTDAYGGSLENRLRFPLEVFDALRDAWPKHKPMSVRISATDWKDGGITGEDCGGDRAGLRRARRRPRRRLHGPDRARFRAGLRPHVPDAVCRPDPQRGRHRHHVRRQHHHRRPGQHHPGRRPRRPRGAGRPHLASPSFTLDAAAQYGFEPVHCPPQYLPGKDQLMRTWARQREDLRELRLKARPG
jgi:anthraniloyl-CoA monooxygenase